MAEAESPKSKQPNSCSVGSGSSQGSSVKKTTISPIKISPGSSQESGIKKTPISPAKISPGSSQGSGIKKATISPAKISPGSGSLGVGVGPSSILKSLETPTIFGELLREMIMQNKIEEPIVFRQIHKDWQPCKWTLGHWGDIFRNEKLSVRYGRQKWDHESPQWESLCDEIKITWTRLIDWVRGEFQLPFENSSTDDIWMYYDYKYLPEVIHMTSELEKDFLKLIYMSENLKKSFTWNNLGFQDRNGDHSTLWIGTKGSYTNMHYDTYSCNLISQVYGRKTWLVFPPCDTAHLRPTRVPYEESSVYSMINVASEKQIEQNLEALSKCSPRKIVLEPGDVLFLPSKWWHFVKSEDLSISVNTWIEMPSDHFTRVEEAVLRTIVSSFVNSSLPSTADKILNPNEMDLTEVSEKNCEETLLLAANAYFDHLKRLKSKEESSRSEDDTVTEPAEKRRKIEFGPGSLNLKNLVKYAPVPVEKLKMYRFVKSGTGSGEEKPSTSSSLASSSQSSEGSRKTGSCNKRSSDNVSTENGSDGNPDDPKRSERPRSEQGGDSQSSCGDGNVSGAVLSVAIADSNNDSPSSDKVDNEDGEEQDDKSCKKSAIPTNRSPTFLEDVLNAVGHPDCLKKVALQFLRNVKERNSSK